MQTAPRMPGWFAGNTSVSDANLKAFAWFFCEKSRGYETVAAVILAQKAHVAIESLIEIQVDSNRHSALHAVRDYASCTDGRTSAG